MYVCTHSEGLCIQWTGDRVKEDKCILYKSMMVDISCLGGVFVVVHPVTETGPEPFDATTCFDSFLKKVKPFESTTRDPGFFKLAIKSSDVGVAF